MLHRYLTEKLKKNLARMPAVALLGPRQVGKTTLAKSLIKHIDAIYLDLESPSDLLKLSDPETFLSSQRGKLVIIDELQRSPNLFMALRGIIDNNRENGFKTGQFLLLGSASMDLMRQSAESLAGRITYMQMSGLNIFEIRANPNTTKTLWVRGGFPDSYLSADNEQAMEWLEDLIRTYLERDIPQMGFNIPATRLRRLWTMIAHMQGEALNYSKLASNLEIDNKTVTNYLDILTDLLLIRRLEPWHTNAKKRMIKSPRYYIRDSGIQHKLLNINNYDALLSNPVLGKSWEGFVIENILSVLPRNAQPYYYRTASGAEIDLVIIMPNSDIWCVEIKFGSNPKINKHFNRICDELSATKKYIVFGGEESFNLSKDTMMITLKDLMQLIIDSI